MRDKLPSHNRLKTCLMDACSSLSHPFWAQDILRRVGKVIRTLGGTSCVLIFPGLLLLLKFHCSHWLVLPSSPPLQVERPSLRSKRRPGEHGFFDFLVYIWKLELQKVHNHQRWFIWWLKASMRPCKKLLKGWTVHVRHYILQPLVSRSCQWLILSND